MDQKKKEKKYSTSAECLTNLDIRINAKGPTYWANTYDGSARGTERRKVETINGPPTKLSCG